MRQNSLKVFKEYQDMIEKTYTTESGTIHYWTNMVDKNQLTLVFLPGLTADHRLFEKQIEYFEHKYNVFVWDAPAHAASWPFCFDFNLMDKARWLNEIFDKEGIHFPVIIGQSMGGYVGQCYSELYPEKLSGFVSIDSAPLQRKYVSSWEIWLLKRMEPFFKYYPWHAYVSLGANGVAVTKYGKNLMRDMIMVYEGDKERYVRISGHGLRMLAEAMEADLPYIIHCPAMLICGKRDMSGSAIWYNKKWHKNTKIPLHMIKGAGHNSNTDKPEEINHLIENFISRI